MAAPTAGGTTTKPEDTDEVAAGGELEASVSTELESAGDEDPSGLGSASATVDDVRRPFRLDEVVVSAPTVDTGIISNPKVDVVLVRVLAGVCIASPTDELVALPNSLGNRLYGRKQYASGTASYVQVVLTGAQCGAGQQTTSAQGRTFAEGEEKNAS